ncbi:MAG: transcription antitermination factor NusB [Ruminiclostridium sp.]|nr:transcription antitermination factor NusB [Ruminiclostridium sp.]
MKGIIKMTRREVREGVFLLLFQNELSAIEINETAEACVEAFEMELNNEVKGLAEKIVLKYDELDGIIGKYSETREVSRISKINKTILRLAIYEIIYCPNVPDVVAVNEAVELSKKYAEKKDSGFINGILGNVLKDKPDASE